MIVLGDVRDGLVRADGTIVESVYQGILTHYLVELYPGARLTVVEKNAERADVRALLPSGAAMMIGWRPEHGLVLDQGSSPAGR